MVPRSALVTLAERQQQRRRHQTGQAQEASHAGHQAPELSEATQQVQGSRASNRSTPGHPLPARQQGNSRNQSLRAASGRTRVQQGTASTQQQGSVRTTTHPSTPGRQNTDATHETDVAQLHHLSPAQAFATSALRVPTQDALYVRGHATGQTLTPAPTQQQSAAYSHSRPAEAQATSITTTYYPVTPQQATLAAAAATPAMTHPAHPSHHAPVSGSLQSHQAVASTSTGQQASNAQGHRQITDTWVVQPTRWITTTPATGWAAPPVPPSLTPQHTRAHSSAPLPVPSPVTQPPTEGADTGPRHAAHAALADSHHQELPHHDAPHTFSSASLLIPAHLFYQHLQQSLQPGASSAVAEPRTALPRRDIHTVLPQGPQADPPSQQGPGEAVALGDSGAGPVYEPEEEQRRVRRRHRKRLAALVVEHWKWFAREGLQGIKADRHYWQQLMGAALVGLQANVVTAHANRRLAAVHRARCTHLLLDKVMQEWRSVAGCRVWLRRTGQELAAHHRQRLCRQVLRAWSDWRWQCVRQRQLEMKAVHYHAFVTLSRALSGWRQRTQLKQRTRWLTVVARRHWQRACKQRALTAWVDVVAWRQHKAKLWGQAVSWNRYHVLSGVLQWWSAMVRAQRAARGQARPVLEALRERWHRQTVAKALRMWLIVAKRSQELIEVSAELRLRLAHLRLTACLSAWQAWAQRERELRVAARALAPWGRVWRLGVVWDRWWEVVDSVRHLRTVEMRGVVLQRATWRSWVAYVGHKQRKRELQQAWTQAMRRMWQRACLRGWKEQALRLRRKALCWQVAEDAHRAHILVTVMKGWLEWMEHAHHKRQQWLQAVAHWRVHTLRHALRSWMVYYRWRVLKRDVVTWARRGLVSAVLLSWRAVVRERVAEEQRWRTAVQHRRASLLRRGLAALSQTVAHRHHKQWLWARSALHHRHSLLLRALLAWAHTVLPMAAEMRVLAARAAGHWRRRLLYRAFHGWLLESARLAVKRGRQREADAFARHCLLNRAMLAWAHGVVALRQHRAAKTKRLQEATRTLHLSRLNRIFTAWHDLHIQCVLEQLQQLRAGVHLRQTRQRQVLAAWHQRVAESHQQALLVARALQHWSLTCRACAWQAWRGHLERRRAKQHMQQMAEGHRAQVLRRHVLAALRWYVSYRRAKASDIQAALELHTTLLQKEGVAQWLRVGLDRRAARLRTIASSQAKLLAAELALVEPYARHWRRVTRARQAQRLSAFEAQVLGAAPNTAHAATRPVPPPPLAAGARVVLQAPPLPLYKRVQPVAERALWMPGSSGQAGGTAAPVAGQAVAGQQQGSPLRSPRSPPRPGPMLATTTTSPPQQATAHPAATVQQPAASVHSVTSVWSVAGRGVSEAVLDTVDSLPGVVHQSRVAQARPQLPAPVLGAKTGVAAPGFGGGLTAALPAQRVHVNAVPESLLQSALPVRKQRPAPRMPAFLQSSGGGQRGD